jgi:nitrate reductase / nitrite oxidoreductase, beta subunit
MPSQPRRRCKTSGSSGEWIEAAQNSPVYRLIVDYQLALPLHPEYRTMPMVWYIPPLSPVVDILAKTGHDGENKNNLFGAIDALRVPVEYLAELFTAGDVGPVRLALQRLAAMRSYMRAANLGEEFDDTIPESVRLTGEEIESMYRLLAIAKYADRYVIPSGAGSDAHRLDALATGCSLDGDGGPGMTAYDAMAEKFHLTNGNGTSKGNGNGNGAKPRTVNLLNWDGKSTDGLVPTK